MSRGAERERVYVLIARLRDAGIQLWTEGERLRFRARAGAMTPELRTLLKQRKAEILAFVGARASTYAPIPRVPDAEHYPLSRAQRRVWVLSQLDDARAAYNLPIHLLLKGPLDTGRIVRAFARLVTRHEALRTRFVVVDGEPRQRVDPPSCFAVRHLDLSTRARPREAARVLARDEAGADFDLERGPLFRVTLARIGPAEHALLMTMHHIVSDGWSLSVLMGQLSRDYVEQARAGGVESPSSSVGERALQYRDYAAWHNAQLASEDVAVHRRYWLETLASAPRLELATDRPRGGRQTYRGALRTFSIDPAARLGLEALARSEGASLFMALVALLDVQLFRYTGRQRVVLGTPIAGRLHPALRDQVGFYLNTLVLVSPVASTMSYRELLRDVRERTLAAYEHQDYPFDQLVNELSGDRDRARAPIFDVCVMMQNAGPLALTLPGIAIESLYQDNGTSKFDLTFDFELDEQGLLLGIRYNTDLFCAERIAAMGEHFSALARAVIEDPARPIRTLEMLSPRERAAVTSSTARPPVAVRASVIDQIAARCARTPERVAVRCRGRSLRYRELWSRAAGVAEALRRRGVGAGDRVAFLLERSENLAIAVLGVMASRAAFIPLDPRHPRARLVAMSSRGELAAVIVDPSTRTLARELFGALTLDITAVEDGSLTSRPIVDELDGLAYIIFTSGTSGQPKGVMISHRSLSGNIECMRRAPGYSDDDVVLSVTTPAFDPFYVDLLAPLVCGGAVLLAAPEDLTDPQRLADLIDNARVDGRGVTSMKTTPSLWRILIAGGWAPRRAIKILCGGEPMSSELAASLLERGAELWNLYGPTETTIWTTVCRVDNPADVSVGTPIPGDSVYVLDPEGALAPIGVPGEIYIGGAGVALGYWAQPELTASAFVRDPFAPQLGAEPPRMYRTGDLGRWRFDGQLECLGRADGQLKIRGHRVETSGVEGHLLEHPAIHEAAVVGQRDATGATELVAFVTATPGAIIDAAAIRATLGQTLPSYMVPSIIVPLDRLPRSPNGKLDRRALPRALAAVSPATKTATGCGDADELSALITQRFAESLGVERIEQVLDRDFFELGGHSLKAVQLVARLREHDGVDVTLADLLSAPTPRALAAVVRARKPGAFVPIEPLPSAERYPASSAQQRLWVLAWASETSTLYNMPVSLRMVGALDVPALEAALRGVVERHEALRTTFEHSDRVLWQRVHARVDLPFTRYAGLDPLSEREVRAIVERDATQPFDLDRGPLLRAGLARLSAAEHVLILNVHHIVSDAWSMRVLAAELVKRYAAASEGRVLTIPPLRVQYRDYVAWQARLEERGVLARQREYWLRRLGAPLRTGRLPTDAPRVPGAAVVSALTSIHIPPARVDELRALATAHRASLFCVLTAAVRVVLLRHFGVEDCPLGCPMSGRDHPELHEQIGFYVNTVVLRDHVRPNMSFRALLELSRATLRGALANAVYPFDRVLNALARQGRVDATAPLDVVIDFHVDDGGGPRLPGVEVTPFFGRVAASKFELLFLFNDEPDGLHLTLEYDRALFRRDRMEALNRHLSTLLSAVARDPDAAIVDYALDPGPAPKERGRGPASDVSQLERDQREEFNL